MLDQVVKLVDVLILFPVAAAVKYLKLVVISEALRIWPEAPPATKRPLP